MSHFHILSSLTLFPHTKWTILLVYRWKQKSGPFSLLKIFWINKSIISSLCISLVLCNAKSETLWYSYLTFSYILNYVILIKSIIIALSFSGLGDVSNIVILLNLRLSVTCCFFFSLQLTSLIRIKIFSVATEDKFSY